MICSKNMIKLKRSVSNNWLSSCNFLCTFQYLKILIPWSRRLKYPPPVTCLASSHAVDLSNSVSASASTFVHQHRLHPPTFVSQKQTSAVPRTCSIAISIGTVIRIFSNYKTVSQWRARFKFIAAAVLSAVCGFVVCSGTSE